MMSTSESGWWSGQGKGSYGGSGGSRVGHNQTFPVQVACFVKNSGGSVVHINHVNIMIIPNLKAKEVSRLDRNSRVFRCRFICATVANAFSHPSYVQ